MYRGRAAAAQADQRRRRARNRRALIGGILVLVVLAAIGVAVWRLAGSPGTVASQSSTTLSLSATATSGTTATPSTNPPATTTSSATASTESTTTTFPAAPNLAPQKLSLTSTPSKAEVEITLQDHTTQTGTTPFTEQVPGGHITVKVTASGYIDHVEAVQLDKAQTLSVWLDPVGQLLTSVVRFKTGPEPKQVAFTPDNEELWVSDLGGYGVEVFEPLTGKKLAQVKLGKYGAVEVIFNHDGTKVFASQMESGSVYEIDRATRKVLHTFKTKGTWTKVMALSPDEKTLYAANWTSNNVSAIDLDTGSVHLIKTVSTPRGLYVTKDGKRLFVCGYGKGDIQVIDLDTDESRSILHTGGAMRHMVADSQGVKLYVNDMMYRKVYVVDIATEKATFLADTDYEPNTIDLSPDGKVLYASCRGKNGETYLKTGPQWGSVLAIDTTTGKVLDAIVGGNQCTGLDVSPNGKTLAFSDFLDNRIRVYSIPDYQVLAEGNGGLAVSHLKDLDKATAN
jgi:YVTN family beta-propeller protein